MTVVLEKSLVTSRIRSMTGRYCFHRCLSVNISGGVPGLRFSGGDLVSDFRGGYLVSDFRGGGYLVSDFWGGTWSQIFGGGTWSQIFGGVPGLRFSGGGGYLVLVKGKIFDSRFGLIHVQTGEKNFLLRDPPPPQ